MIGEIIIDLVGPFLEYLATCKRIPMGDKCVSIIPGTYFPEFFTWRLLQRALLGAIMISIVGGFFGTFLMIRNFSLIGDGLAHVSFGGVAVGIVLGSVAPLWFALLFSILAAIAINQMQTKNILTGDASIAIFLTGTLGLGLVILRYWGSGITADVEGYLWGSLVLIDEESFNLIALISIISILSMIFLYHSLLSISIDPIAAKVQGIPVSAINLYFSIITAAVVVSMVQIVGALLVTAILVTPSATAQLIGKSFRSCIIYSQVIGVSTVILGIYLSSELNTGSGATIALLSATIFCLVIVFQTLIKKIIQPKVNFN